MGRRALTAGWCIALLASVCGCGSDEDLAEAIYTAGHGDASVRVWIPINEPRSTGTYRAEVEWGDGVTDLIEEERDGMIAGVWMEDLVGDGQPELVVATASAGSGTYGAVRVYGRTESEPDVLRLAPLSEAQRIGYLGHDVFSVEGGRLGRSHPIYVENDTNASPSGGTAAFYYSFADSAWTAVEGDTPETQS
ncbi:MAG TPA: PliI family lysozyme inhibitor of I-type lysozyme [bacterium]|nr:PliI family lysozyme inhibitor of I-type lysozyme [bacterium]